MIIKLTDFFLNHGLIPFQRNHIFFKFKYYVCKLGGGGGVTVLEACWRNTWTLPCNDKLLQVKQLWIPSFIFQEAQTQCVILTRRKTKPTPGMVHPCVRVYTACGRCGVVQPRLGESNPWDWAGLVYLPGHRDSTRHGLSWLQFNQPWGFTTPSSDL